MLIHSVIPFVDTRIKAYKTELLFTQQKVVNMPKFVYNIIYLCWCYSYNNFQRG